MTLCYLTRSGGESEVVGIGASVGALFYESEQLGSHDGVTRLDVETGQPLVLEWVVKEPAASALLRRAGPV